MRFWSSGDIRPFPMRRRSSLYWRASSSSHVGVKIHDPDVGPECSGGF